MSRRSGAHTIDPATQWKGSYVRYDIAKEFVIALVVVALLTILLSALFSSPDRHPVTIASWSKAAPDDFVSTAVSELDGSSTTAGYGAPYNNTPDTGQKIGPVSLQNVPGVRIPVDTAHDFVIGPLSSVNNDPALRAALARYQAASSEQQDTWTKNYSDALNHASYRAGTVVVPPGNYGPVSRMMQGELSLARSGGLDGYLLSTPQFYSTDYTKPLLFLSDGTYMASLAQADHLQGSQWGMMNETGSYPGQAWLWLYTMWYQISPFNHSGNADALIWGIMFVLTLGLVLLPFIPGLRSLPRHLGVHRLIWRDYYREVEGRST
jgi:hypothetical protein